MWLEVEKTWPRAKEPTRKIVDCGIIGWRLAETSKGQYLPLSGRIGTGMRIEATYSLVQLRNSGEAEPELAESRLNDLKLKMENQTKPNQTSRGGCLRQTHSWDNFSSCGFFSYLWREKGGSMGRLPIILDSSYMEYIIDLMSDPNRRIMFPFPPESKKTVVDRYVECNHRCALCLQFFVIAENDPSWL